MNNSNTNEDATIKSMHLAIESLSNEVEDNVRRALLNNCAYVFQYELGSAYQCCLQQAYQFLGYYNENALAISPRIPSPHLFLNDISLLFRCSIAISMMFLVFSSISACFPSYYQFNVASFKNKRLSHAQLVLVGNG